jgi:putative ABC transport system substrate-binding protein
MMRQLILRVCKDILAGTLILAALHAQAAEPEKRTVRLGFVNPLSESALPSAVAHFWDRLRDLGWVEGDNVVVERRSAEGQVARLPAIMHEVVGRRLDVLVTSGTPAAAAAHHATKIVPIVVIGMGDPVGSGLAASLAKPGANLTGISTQWGEGELVGKWFELLHDAIPRLVSIAVISNPESSIVRRLQKNLEAIAADRSVKLRFADVRESVALPRAVKQAAQNAQAALVISDPVTATARKQIAQLAAQHRLPALYVGFEFMDAGGLMAYGVNNRTLYRDAAEYVDKILRGARPGDLPIRQPTEFSLAVNLEAARALGLTIPDSILLRADEVVR